MSINHIFGASKPDSYGNLEYELCTLLPWTKVAIPYLYIFNKKNPHVLKLDQCGHFYNPSGFEIQNYYVGQMCPFTTVKPIKYYVGPKRPEIQIFLCWTKVAFQHVHSKFITLDQSGHLLFLYAITCN